jgi:hypothetical protein
MSLLMLPALIVSAIPAAVVGIWLLGRRDLEGSEPMSVQGVYGWMVFAVSTAIFVIPLVVGVILAAKAYRGGERRLGLTGMLVDGAILVLYPIVGILGLLGQ